MQTVKGGRITTTANSQEIILNKYPEGLKKVTVFNQSKNKIHIIINGGGRIPLEMNESISFGVGVKVISIIVIEEGSTVRYIGV